MTLPRVPTSHRRGVPALDFFYVKISHSPFPSHTNPTISSIGCILSSDLLCYYTSIVSICCHTSSGFPCCLMPPILRSRKSDGSGSRPPRKPALHVPTLPENEDFVAIPAGNSSEVAIKQIEGIFESIVDSLARGAALAIPYRTRNNRNASAQAQCQVLMFPARSSQELKKFGNFIAIFRFSFQVKHWGNPALTGPRGCVLSAGVGSRGPPLRTSYH